MCASVGKRSELSRKSLEWTGDSYECKWWRTHLERLHLFLIDREELVKNIVVQGSKGWEKPGKNRVHRKKKQQKERKKNTGNVASINLELSYKTSLEL